NPREISTWIERRRQLGPRLPAAIQAGPVSGVARPERPIPCAQAADAPVGRGDATMRVLEQHALDLPYIRSRHTPIVIAHSVRNVDDRVAGDPPREIDVRIDVAQRKRARRREYRLSAVKTRVVRPCDGSPATAAPVHEQHVIELVDRLEAEHER